MTYDVPVAPGEKAEIEETTELSGESWPMWEVFVRARRGISHVHIGSLHAADAETALENARDVYTRRGEGVSVWVVPSTEVARQGEDEAPRDGFAPRTRVAERNAGAAHRDESFGPDVASLPTWCSLSGLAN